jgi:hypothetical protein
MGTKEHVGDGLKKLARLVPGIESYQDKEALREGDKQLRQALADRLDAAAKGLDRIVFQTQQSGRLEHLATLGRLEQRLHGTADAIRYAAYGYSGLFATGKVDEGRIQKLYDFDLALAEAVDTVQDHVRFLAATGPEEIGRGASLEPLDTGISLLEDQVRERTALFSSDLFSSDSALSTAAASCQKRT